MAGSSSDDTIKVWPPLVWVCRWIWKRRAILFGIDILSAVWAGLPLIDITAIDHLVIVHALVTWILPHWLFLCHSLWASAISDNHLRPHCTT